MIGALPSGLFGLAKPTMGQPQNVAGATPPPAYVNGPGGARLTPDMIAQRSRMAQGMIASGMDTSPVGSWTQGLARVAQAIVGNMQQSRLDKAQMQNADADRQILKSLSGTGGNDAAVLAAMADPNVGDGVRDALKLQWQASHKTPAQPHYWETNDGSLGMIGADGKPTIVYQDPNAKMNFIPDGLGGGQWVAVPTVQGGGGQLSPAPMASAVPTAPVGKLTPIGGGAPSQGARTFP